jgi:hypothetical protein
LFLDQVGIKVKEGKYDFLYNAFLLAEQNGSMESKCWVVEWEKEESRGQPLYKHVGNAMKTFKLLNILPESNTTTVYSESSIPISIDNFSYDYFNKHNHNPFCCHHPFLCELNDECRGVQLSSKGSIIITHCCIRPSHLVNLNSDFNNYCTILQNLKDNKKCIANW